MSKLPSIIAAGEQELQFIEAAAAPIDLKKVDGVAYSGGTLTQYWSRFPLVVDLAGMSMSSQVPLLYSHINDPDYRLGVIEASIADFKLNITGGISSKSEKARNIIDQAKDFNWQLSIGAENKRTEFVEAGVKVTVNNREFTGPINIVRSSVLREVSVVAVGANEDTHLKIAAKFQPQSTHQQQTQGGMHMKKEMMEFIIAKFGLAAGSDEAAIRAHLETVKLTETDIAAMMPKDPDSDATAKIKAAGVTVTTIPAQPGSEVGQQIKAAQSSVDMKAMIRAEMEAERKAESERIGKIQAICAGEHADIQAKAVGEGWTPEATSDAVLKAIRAKRPSADFNIIVTNPLEGKERRGSIEAALCIRAGLDGEGLIKSYGEKVIEAANKQREMSLKEAMIQCLRLEGKPIEASFDNDTIRAAFSTVSLPGILSNVANKKMLRSFAAQPIIATKLCSEGDLNDFKKSDRYRMTDVGDIEPIGADGELKESGLGEDSATNQLDTYGKTFTLTRKMIMNDDLGMFLKIPTAMGNRAARKIDQLFFARLMSNPVQSDNNALFSAAHKNYIAGATTKLDATGLQSLTKVFLDQVDSDDQPISIEPRFLLVPTDLKIAAIELTKGAVFIVSGQTDSLRPAMNSLADMNLNVISSPYLNNTKYPGYSATAYYLFGDPNQVDTFEIGYLKGKRTPTVETGSVDFNTLGISYRVYFDLGIREQDFRGMAMSKGKA